MEFDTITIIVLALTFVWSGFVRAGLGFGGATLVLPFALLVINSPIFIIPIISLQLLVFSLLTLLSNFHNVHWRWVGRFVLLLAIPMGLGILGLVTLPDLLLETLLYLIVIGYAVTYIFPFKLARKNKTIDFSTLFLGGYLTGVSLTGAPLIVAVAMRYVPARQVRDTLFALWVLLAAAKLYTLYQVNVNLQLVHQLWLFPCAFVGHLIGLRFHKRLLEIRTRLLYQVMGATLLVVSLVGLGKCLFIFFETVSKT